MKTVVQSGRSSQQASALVLTLVMTGVAFTILAGAMTYSMNSNKLTQRSIQYNRAVLAAEAATEKITSQVIRDFLHGGQKLVSDKIPVYEQMVPTSSDSPYWNYWEFNNGLNQIGRTFIKMGASNYGVVDGLYAGLNGFSVAFTVVSHARENGAIDTTGGVLQELQLVRVPIFQNSLYSSGDMEISCGKPFFVTGRVHCNKTLYLEPDSVLTFGSDVTAVTDILEKRHPEDNIRGAPAGSTVFVFPDKKLCPVDPLTLPIGATNTPEAIREIIHPPPPGEDPNSDLGLLRYYNQVDMLITVTDFGIFATSGKFDNFTTDIPTNEVKQFVSTSTNFWDMRESKMVKPVDINIGLLKTWSETNGNLRPALGTNSLYSVYIHDKRNVGTNLAAVRVMNGRVLPDRGLTVATARPLYVQGHFNQLNVGNLGTTNTITTKPSSLVGDAITVLSTSWSDANAKGINGVGSRMAGNTTVNAAFLTGAVETKNGNYSGGMENFPRFLETWGSIVFTYNGSMVKMFNSLYATNIWGKAEVYAPPTRNWAYDRNFEKAELIPPHTPCMVIVSRGKWATVAPDKNVVTAGP